MPRTGSNSDASAPETNHGVPKLIPSSEVKQVAAPGSDSVDTFAGCNRSPCYTRRDERRRATT
jgi:hypothetical protein